MELEEPNEYAHVKFASQGTRFINYILDAVCFCFLVLIFMMFFGVPEQLSQNKSSLLITIYLNGSILVYYVAFEFFFSKTPAKFLTRTKVVDHDGEKPGFNKILIRSLCRFIPFESFSFLFSLSGWHDSFSKTYVIIG